MRSPRFLLRGFKPAREVLDEGLGALERRVMEFLWDAQEARVRDVCDHFGSAVAYTTVMTTLDRLFKKRLLTRRKHGRAFVYAAAASRAECDLLLTAELINGLLDRHRDAPVPLLSNLVDTVSDRDRQLLDELERLVREKRAELGDRETQ
jgi:predicted transcriptional regulator